MSTDAFRIVEQAQDNKGWRRFNKAMRKLGYPALSIETIEAELKAMTPKVPAPKAEEVWSWSDGFNPGPVLTDRRCWG